MSWESYVPVTQTFLPEVEDTYLEPTISTANTGKGIMLFNRKIGE